MNKLHDLAQRCRFWSRATYDLTAARQLRNIADELEEEATHDHPTKENAADTSRKSD